MTTTPSLKPKQTARETGAEMSREKVRLGIHDASASPDSERRRVAASMDFDSLPDVEALARQQGVSSSTKFEDLLGNFWPENQDVDDFLAARERWRREGCDPSD